jgi:hypothetical protein
VGAVDCTPAALGRVGVQQRLGSLQLDAHPIANYFSLSMDQVIDLSFYNPDAFRVDVAGMPEQQQAVMAADNSTLQAYGGTTMADPGLLDRGGALKAPTPAGFPVRRLPPVPRWRSPGRTSCASRTACSSSTGSSPTRRSC